MSWLSLNCLSERDRPNADHHCGGCDCHCHHVPAPANLREMVDAAKPESVNACADGIECMARGACIGETSCKRGRPA